MLWYLQKGVKKCLWWLQPSKARKTTETAAYLHTRAKVVFISLSLKFFITKYYKIMNEVKTLSTLKKGATNELNTYFAKPTEVFKALREIAKDKIVLCTLSSTS